MCVLSNQVNALWTSPLIPGVSCEDKNFFTTGRWGTSPCRGPPLPCKQALSWPRSWILEKMSLELKLYLNQAGLSILTSLSSCCSSACSWASSKMDFWRIRPVWPTQDKQCSNRHMLIMMLRKEFKQYTKNLLIGTMFSNAISLAVPASQGTASVGIRRYVEPLL